MQLLVDGKIHGLFMKAKKERISFPKTTTTAAHDILTDAVVDELVDDLDHPCLILVEVTETFANGNGAQPTFKIGQTGTVEKFLASASLTGAVIGTKFVTAGVLTHETDLICTATVATGTATGAIRVTAVAFRSR